ncbi:MAG: hypothetical protein K2Q09_08220 [Phycisphaerales bacterium]|nr:hypothetical protein [Phycisphaerales bacterium]
MHFLRARSPGLLAVVLTILGTAACQPVRRDGPERSSAASALQEGWCDARGGSAELRPGLHAVSERLAALGVGADRASVFERDAAVVLHAVLAADYDQYRAFMTGHGAAFSGIAEG